MKRSSAAVVVVALLAAGCAARSHEPKVDATDLALPHIMLPPKEIKWQSFPAGGPGAQWAVLAGDPEKPGPFVLRIKQPGGNRVAPHWHPTDEHVTVLQGRMAFGMGEKFDRKAGHELPAGSYLLLPREQPHFAWVVGKETGIVQVHGMGPFQVFFVNPADDPRNQAEGAPSR